MMNVKNRGVNMKPVPMLSGAALKALVAKAQADTHRYGGSGKLSDSRWNGV